MVASLLVIPVASSAAKMRGACERFRRAVTWMGLTLAAVTGPVVAAYVVLRCAPPVDTDLPPDWTIVSPVTAAGDIDILRRAARLGLEGMAIITQALLDPIVSALLVGIGGRIKRLKTKKDPVLYAEVAAAVAAAATSPTAIAVRDAFALALGLHFALRASELLALRGADLALVDDGKALQLTFRNVKNRQSVFSSHDPFVVSAGGAILMQAYALFNEHVGFRNDLVIFHNLRHGVNYEKPLSRDWLGNVTQAAAPDRTPHSLRVGAATELYAAGVDLPTIMAIGRWTSSAALLYVLGTLEDTVEATGAMGSGGLRITKEGLRRATRASIPRGAIPRADAARWRAACEA
jgi:integrase